MIINFGIMKWCNNEKKSGSFEQLGKFDFEISFDFQKSFNEQSTEFVFAQNKLTCSLSS